MQQLMTGAVQAACKAYHAGLSDGVLGRPSQADGLGHVERTNYQDGYDKGKWRQLDVMNAATKLRERARWPVGAVVESGGKLEVVG